MGEPTKTGNPDSGSQLPTRGRRDRMHDMQEGSATNTFVGRKTIFTEFSSVKQGIARIGKHGPKIRSQMFQFSWKLFLEMKKTTKPNLDIKKKMQVFKIYSIIQSSRRGRTTGRHWANNQVAWVYFQLCQKPCELGQCCLTAWGGGGGGSRSGDVSAVL